MKTDDQVIYQKLGELLWSVMSPEDSDIIFRGQVYSDHQDFQLLSNTNRIPRYIEIPTNLFFDLRELMENLKKCSVFSKEPWTHFKVFLNEKGNFKIEFAYIPEENSWVGLYMRSVSDLDQSELDEYNIPLEDWRNCIKAKKN
jgi:hypothetical protein